MARNLINLITNTPFLHCAAEDDLHGYVDGSLDPAARARVEAYLSEFPAERERLEAYRWQNVLLHRIYDRAHREPLPARHAVLAGQLSRQLKRQARFGAARRVVSAAAVVVLVAAAGWTGYDRFARPDSPFVAFTRQASEAHVMLLGERDPSGKLSAPSKKGTHIFDRIASPDLGLPRRPPDLAGHGFKLIGVRTMQAGDLPAVQLLYGDGEQHRVTLFMGASRSKHKSVSTIIDDGKATLVYWQLGSFAFSLIGNMGHDTMLAMAGTVSRSLTQQETEPVLPQTKIPRAAPLSPEPPQEAPVAPSPQPPGVTPVGANSST